MRRLRVAPGPLGRSASMARGRLHAAPASSLHLHGDLTMARIQSHADFRKALAAALVALEPIARETPEREILAIQEQLVALERWTRDDRAPTQDEKDALHFGMLASRYLADIDPHLAQQLFSIASYVTYW